ncbi:hypothetical protein FXO37_10633 [Capsicum annuum]|nr:hypothetical protein FXO37_10633 [Capsicum annuum]
MNNDIRKYVLPYTTFTLSLIGLGFIMDLIAYVYIDAMMNIDAMVNIDDIMMPGKSGVYIDDIMMPNKSRGYIDDIMMSGKSRGYIDGIMMSGKSEGYIDDIMIPGKSEGYIDDMMMSGMSGGYIDDIMKPDAVLGSLLCVSFGCTPWWYGMPCMPLDYDINFAIDVKPSTKPICFSPYRMYLTKLKKKFQDLLSKGFTRPSLFPLSVPSC